jgi:hypothetical protein
MAVGTAHDERHMRRHAIGLRGPLAHRMAVEATRVLQHLADVAEQRDRSCLVGLLRQCRRHEGESDNSYQKANDHLGPSSSRAAAWIASRMRM